jgi:hypothetical protein
MRNVSNRKNIGRSNYVKNKKYFSNWNKILGKLDYSYILKDRKLWRNLIYFPLRKKLGPIITIYFYKITNDSKCNLRTSVINAINSIKNLKTPSNLKNHSSTTQTSKDKNSRNNKPPSNSESTNSNEYQHKWTPPTKTCSSNCNANSRWPLSMRLTSSSWNPRNSRLTPTSPSWWTEPERETTTTSANPSVMSNPKSNRKSEMSKPREPGLKMHTRNFMNFYAPPSGRTSRKPSTTPSSLDYIHRFLSTKN